MSRCKAIGLAMVLGLLLASGVWAQPAPGGGGDRGNRGGRDRGDPAQWRQQFMDSIKERLGATDDEWKVLQPKLEKVMQARREASAGFGGMMFGGRRGGDRRTPETAIGRAQADLRQALENNAPAADIQRKLQALREARDKAREELKKTQAELKELLTQKQEAQLVLMDWLE